MPQNWSKYPMGPQVRSWLGLETTDETDATLADDAKNKSAFTNFLIEHGRKNPISIESEFATLLEEILVMDLPFAVLALARMHRETSAIPDQKDFRGVNAEGISAMIVGEIDLAKSCLSEANAINGEEPGPYTNMSQIFLQEGDWDAAELWTMAGLKVAKNHFPLWELLFENLSQREKYPREALKVVATQMKAWAGYLLLAETDPHANARTKYEYLEEFYFSGERSIDFLIEYTAALGIAQLFEKIPPIVWQAEKLSSEPLSWRLYVHMLQAVLSMDQRAEFVSLGEKVLQKKILPRQATDNLVALMEEIRQELAGETNET